MGANSRIEWCDHTFNPWVGCQKVGPGCDHCYAEGWAKRSGLVTWGPHGLRRRTREAYWREPIRWNARAAAAGRAETVFCASLADWADKQAPPGARTDLFTTIRVTPHLVWLLLSKRIGNIPAALPADWDEGYPNVMLMITVVNQEEANRDINRLRLVPARARGLSIEPMLGRVDLCEVLGIWWNQTTGAWARHRPSEIHWVICGGESGPGARPMHPNWARSLRDQCQAAGVPFFFKQWGEWLPWLEFSRAPAVYDPEPERSRFPAVIWNASGEAWDEHGGGWSDEPGARGPEEPDQIMGRVGKAAAGRLLDGREWNEFPSLSSDLCPLTPGAKP